MLKRTEIIALSKRAIERVASGKAGTIPANKRHLHQLAKLKREKKEARDAPDAYGNRKRA
jgi:hypothetical protein